MYPSQHGILWLESVTLQPSLFPPNLATNVLCSWAVRTHQWTPKSSVSFTAFTWFCFFPWSPSLKEAGSPETMLLRIYFLTYVPHQTMLSVALCEFQEITPALFWLWKAGGTWGSGMKRLESFSFHWTRFIQMWGVPSFTIIRLLPTVVWRMFHMYFSST